jgi:predicted  nucleic acid-binding Zn-ribbon protein
VLAEPAVQLRLLDLQALDTVLNQLAHRRKSLPELATIADCEARAAEARVLYVDAQTELADLDGEQRRMEADVDTVRQRAARDQQRMESGALPAKELTGLQHEIASLARRQGVLEDDLLELMERRETAEAAVNEHSKVLEAIAAEKAVAEASRDAQFAEIDAATAERQQERSTLVASLPADLVKLYDKIRESGAIGAAILRQRRCEACRLELAGSELSRVRGAKADEVLRCDNCRAILIRTAESGL